MFLSILGVRKHMIYNRRFSFLLVVTLAFVLVFLIAGLPFARLGMTSVNAQYAGPNALDEAGTCGGVPRFQVRLNDGVASFFTSSDLSTVAASVPDAFWQKYLMCGNIDTRADGYVAILFPGNKIFYVNANDVASIVPRNFTDGQ
jgi:hypothetical protein